MTYTSTKQRTFVLMPLPIGRPHVVTVSQYQDGRVTVDDSVAGFWIWLFVVGICAFGVWRLVAKPMLDSHRKSATVVDR